MVHFPMWATCLLAGIVTPGFCLGQEISSESLKQIQDTAAAICGDFEREGFNKSAEVEGKVEAKIAGLLDKLVDAGVEGAGKINSSEYSGLLQNELAADRLDVRNCKREIFLKLVDSLSSSNKQSHSFELDQPPTIDGRTVDGCIRSPQFPESQGLQCIQSAQKTIADEFCRGAGYKYAQTFFARDTGEFQASFKFTEEVPSSGDVEHRWVAENTGGFIFTDISCRS